MTKIHSLLAALAPLCISFVACDKQGACEFATSYGVFGCYDETDDDCGITEDVFGDAYFHDDLTCADIGYYYESDPAYASSDRKRPGSGGAFASGGGGGGGGGSCGSANLDVCWSAWKCEAGSHGASYCQVACAAKLACEPQSQQANCDIMRQFGDIPISSCCPNVCD